MTKTLMPCRHCGGEKPRGQGRKCCDACLEKMKPIFEQEAYQRRLKRAREIRAANGTERRLEVNAPPGLKWCSRCQQYLPFGEFGTRGAKMAAYCRPCASAYNHERILHTFGIDPDRYNELLELQSGRCAICETKPRKRRLSVDHDHETGEVRGLLCTRCNHKLLGAAHDSAAMLRRASRYLEQSPALTGESVPATESDMFELRLGQELDEANLERDNDHADLGVAWFKRRGRTDPGAGYVVMDGATFVKLLRAAGY